MSRWQPDRSAVIAEYAREILTVHPRGRLVLGVDGIESVETGTVPSDREVFATDVAAAIAAEGVPARAVAMTGFAVGSPSDPAGLYDEGAFRAQVLDPYRAGVLDGAASDRAVLVVSGAFLHLGVWAGVWHSSVWLRLPRAVAGERDERRLPATDQQRWDALVDAAFRRVDARKLANATFDLTDPAHPRREFEDAC